MMKRERTCRLIIGLAGDTHLVVQHYLPPTDRPAISEQQTFQCGVIQKFTQVVGEPYLDLLILFLARRDVQSARNGLWHMRPELAESISSDSIRHMMTYGRTGHLPYRTT